MVSGTLYSYSGSFRANKILIAAAYSGSDVKVDPNFEYGKTNKEQSFLKKFPLGKVPAFEDCKGNCLDEANAIAQYISNEQLQGGNCELARAKVRQYVEFAENEILPSACTWTFPTLGFKQYNKQDTEKAIEHLKNCLNILNNDLLTKTFLVGERVTLADITLCCNLVVLYVQVLDPKFREAYGNVNRWFLTCVNQPNFKKVLGEVKLCEKMATFDNKRYQELHPKAQKKGAEKKPREEKKKAEPKKEAAPAADPAPAEPKVKAADFFKGIPESNFVLDDFKKAYKNDGKAAYVKYLWEKFDKNAFSLWYCEYNNPTENTFKRNANNLAGGFYQRIEGLRKFCMSTLNTFKEQPEGGSVFYSIKGVFLFYGTRLPFELNEDWNKDAPYYNIRQLNAESPEDRKLFESMIDEDSDAESWKVFV